MPSPYSWSPVETSTTTGNSLVNALLSGKNWVSSSITFSFATVNNSEWSLDATTGYGIHGTLSEPTSAGYSSLNAAQRESFRNALDAWSNVSGLRFREVSDTRTNVGDIRAAFTDGGLVPDAQAWAYYPGSVANPAGASFGGDVWFSNTSTNFTDPWYKGTYEYVAAMHEIGHALGMKHPFDDTPTMRLDYDSRSYTVMSYSALGGQAGSYFSLEPTTPMVLDILAIQHLYGANTTYASGNNTYVFEDDRNYHKTIWDTGGRDTLDYRGEKSGLIDLRAGHEYGSRMGLSLKAFNAAGDVLRSSMDNVFIAVGTVIENALGSQRSDTIYGNGAKNVLQGRGGNDSIIAGVGNDSLSGGNGNDRLNGQAGYDKLIGGKGADYFIFNTKLGSSNVDTIADFSRVDTIRLENAIFNKLGAPGDLKTSYFRASSSGNAGDSNDYILYETDTGKLFYDADGNGGGAKVKFAVVGTSSHAKLSVDDFQVF